MTRITRLEVIDENGRSYVSWEDDNDVSWQFQDKGKTLKIFVNKVKPKTGEEGALEALDKFQNDWLLGKKCPETKLEIKNLNSVESIKAEIKVLQSKLEFYEELEKQPLTLFDVIRNLGYSVDMCYEIVDAVEEFEKSKEPEKWDVVRESKKWCEEHPDESVEDYLRPKTPEQVADGLKEAFREAVKQGIVSSVDKPKPMNEVLDRLENKYENDDVVNRILKKWEENPPDFLRFELSKSLEALITRWWDDVYDGIHQDWDREVAIDDLIDQIQLWLPKSQSAAGSQSLGVEDMVEGFNDCLNKIKSKLRNKKET